MKNEIGIQRTFFLITRILQLDSSGAVRLLINVMLNDDWATVMQLVFLSQLTY